MQTKCKKCAKNMKKICSFRKVYILYIYAKHAPGTLLMKPEWHRAAARQLCQCRARAAAKVAQARPLGHAGH